MFTVILSDNIGGIIGGTCGIVLMVLMFVVLPIVSKINENAKYKGKRRLDALVEIFTCVEDYSRCLKTKQKGGLGLFIGRFYRTLFISI